MQRLLRFVYPNRTLSSDCFRLMKNDVGVLLDLISLMRKIRVWLRAARTVKLWYGAIYPKRYGKKVLF